MELTIETQPDAGLSKNGLKRAHWRTSEVLTREAREQGYILGRMEVEDGWETLERAEINVVHYYSNRPMDYDGLACSVAPYIDGLVDAEILADDDPSHVIRYDMRHVKVAHRWEAKVAITIKPYADKG